MKFHEIPNEIPWNPSEVPWNPTFSSQRPVQWPLGKHRRHAALRANWRSLQVGQVQSPAVEGMEAHGKHLGPPATKSRSVGANNSNVTMVYGTQITSYNGLVTGANLNQRSHHVWGPHIVVIILCDCRMFQLNHLANLAIWGTPLMGNPHEELRCRSGQKLWNPLPGITVASAGLVVPSHEPCGLEYGGFQIPKMDGL